MIRITFIEPGGQERTVEGREGTSLMETAIEHDVAGIEAICGGACSCGTCKVVIVPEWASCIDAPGKPEEEMLDALEERNPGARLSCQIRLDRTMDNITVTVSPTN
jgi:2Fe-2S ferredoxin